MELVNTALAWLEGFHIRAAYHMAKKHKSKKGLNHVWVYLQSKGVLKECGMNTILNFMGVRRQFFDTSWIGQPTNLVGQESLRGEHICNSGGGRRRCAGTMTTLTQTELENDGTFVGPMESIRMSLPNQQRRFSRECGKNNWASHRGRLCHHSCSPVLQRERVWRVEIVGYTCVTP